MSKFVETHQTSAVLPRRSARPPRSLAWFAIVLLALGGILPSSALASPSYGDLNNFDAVAHCAAGSAKRYGLEIEMHGVRSTDISYTYDWNHYGAPTIREDLSDPSIPKTFVRYAAKTKDALGLWKEFTNCEDPAQPIGPTNGHMCTNPSVNAGCEHFGVGYYGAPAAVIYHWLDDDGTGGGPLSLAEPLSVATPSWTYQPPGPAVAAQVVAVIPAPVVPDPQPQPRAFGEPSWVKVIKTTTHNNGNIRLEDLVGKDGNNDGHDDWTNGEPDEVESEWYLLQDNANGGAKAELAGAPEELPDGDETVTRRYEFYAYIGSEATIDVESGEAMCDAVAGDNLHGVGTRGVTRPDPSNPGEVMTVDVDCSLETVIGEYIGAQMAAFDPAAGLGLIDHIEDGVLDEPYTDRRVVIGGDAGDAGSGYVTSITAGSLPPGLAIDSGTGILSGAPTQAGTFSFTVSAVDVSNATASHAYTIQVVDPNAPPDLTPVVTPAVVGTLGQGGWYTGDVQVDWTIDTRNEAVTSQVGCDPFTVLQDTDATGVVLTCSVVTTGGSAAQSVTIYRDATRPVATATVTPAANGAGWHKAPVTVSFSGSDATPGSGMSGCSAAVTVSVDTSSQNVPGTCSDIAGNASASASATVKLDQVLPTVTLTVPAGNASYAQGAAVQAAYTCADARSLVQSCSGTVAAGASIDTATTGTKTFSVTATDYAGNTRTSSVTYTVVAGTPAYSVSPTSLAFGNQVLKLASATKSITLSSTGNAALPITSIALTGTNANQFVMTSNTCGSSVAAGATCTIAVAFQPTATGAKTASVAVTAGGGAGNKSVALTGTGVAASFTVSTTSLAFGNVTRNTTSAAKTVTVTNSGTVVLPITSITVSGTNANQFAIASNTCPAQVAVGASCTVGVVFKPTSTGKKSGSLVITPGGGAVAKSVSLSGTGL